MVPGDPFEPLLGKGRGSDRPEAEPLLSSSSLIEVARDLRGAVVGAKAIGTGGDALFLNVHRELLSDGAECSIVIDGEAALPVMIGAGIEHTQERAKCLVTAGETTIDWVLDASSYEENHLGVITGQVAGAPISGVLDPRTGASTVALTLEDWIGSIAVTQLAHFAAVFQEMMLRGQAERAEFDDLIRHTIHSSRWGAIGRAACWGLGGLGVAVCSTVTAGVGFLAASAAFAGASSVCSDAVSELERREQAR